MPLVSLEVNCSCLTGAVVPTPILPVVVSAKLLAMLVAPVMVAPLIAGLVMVLLVRVSVPARVARVPEVGSVTALAAARVIFKS